ncbi:pentapeptide repeat-containing protein [Leptolyngbya sp. AN02str]|uniref:pentapeptide repeat-containing protein n=1 Tax=Leptolyngbya sp. AN02str TaxID=3423363 RepID=UPI003D31F4F5
MRQKIVAGCAGTSLLVVLLTAGAVYWRMHPANVDWASRSRDGFSDFRAMDLADENLAEANLSGMVFRESQLSRANLRNANLSRADFSGATYLDEADLQQANLTRALIRYTIAEKANFSQANLQQADLEGANLQGANLSNANLEGAHLYRTLLNGANLSGADLKHAVLSQANLTGANLDGVNLDEVHLCNTILPSGELSQRDCFVPSAELAQALAAQQWREAESATSSLFYQVKYDADNQEVEPNPSCEDLARLDALWHDASNGRFSYRVQRQIWESPSVNQDYGKYAIAVGWRQGSDWLKFDELKFDPTIAEDNAIPDGHLPWHRWQVLEPTEAEPTLFRREGFGRWMAKLKQCNI